MRMVSKQDEAAARRRAREAKAARDAKRAAQEKKIAEANEDFYIALTAIDEAKKALDAATDRRNEAVRALVALDQDDEEIAELTGLSARDVAKIKKTPSLRQRSKNADTNTASASENDGPRTNGTTSDHAVTVVPA